MASPVETVLAALRAKGHEPKRAGAGWNCRCPAHADQTPSLSINVGDDGRVLLNCHAGCVVGSIVGAIGLELSDLYADDPARRNGHAPRRRGDETPPKPASGGGSGTNDAKAYPTANEAVADLERRHGPRSKAWPYHNDAGEPIALIVRWDRPGGGKDIRPVSRIGDRWQSCGMPTPRPLYNLPGLLATAAGSRVFVVEGEKAADAARAVGLTATTSPHGAESASKADWFALFGREVVILPDHDAPGEKYAADVARLAAAAGAKSIRIVRLSEKWPDLPGGGDVDDLLERTGGDVEAIEKLRGEVEALADAGELETTEPQAPAAPAFAPFPVHALPEPIRAFVNEATAAIGCDSSYIALPMLSGLAAAVGNTTRIELKRNWTEPSIIWTAIVGESGAAKSPALELALRPIRKRQHAAMKEHADAMKEHADALAMHERNAANWKKSKSDAPPPASPEIPLADRCWTDDATVEALAVLLQQNPRGLLMIRDELAGWFSFDRYSGGRGGGDVAKWLEMFGGRAMIVDRKGGGTIYVPSASISIAGGIQPATLQKALRQDYRDNGLAARLLFAMPPRKPKRWTEADVSVEIEAAVGGVFDELFKLMMDADADGDERPRLLKLDEGGKLAWVTFYDKHATEQAELSGDEGAAWAKLEGYAARFALVVHLARWAAHDITLRSPVRVDSASVAAGVELARWFGNEARRVYAILGESDEGRESRRLVELVQRKGGNISGRELVQASRLYPKVADAEAALDELVKSGADSWATPDQRGPGQPKARRFTLATVYTVNVYRNPAGGTGCADTVDVDTVDVPAHTIDDTGWGEI